MSNNQIQSQSFFLLDNLIQDYAWGSTDAMSTLFGFDNNENKPQAELWMGAHPNGCSRTHLEGQSVLLSELIGANPEHHLSKRVFTQFGELPYLFKVLAAEKALSIQVHPNKTQAELGFEKEESAGIERSASNRNYKDPNHKPELVYALTPYQAMNGFRSFSEIVENLHEYSVPKIQTVTKAFIEQPNSDNLKSLFEQLLQLDGDVRDQAVEQLLTVAAEKRETELGSIILSLANQYPGDIGLFSPLLLNVITLEPNQAMFLDANTPHAYIHGTGLEIMANSDNVLRAGLTPKYMDVNELIACTSFEPKPFEQLLTEPKGTDPECIFEVPVNDFKFAVIQNAVNFSVQGGQPEIWFAIDGELNLETESGESLTLSKGQSAYIPAYVQQFVVSSSGRAARAYC